MDTKRQQLQQAVDDIRARFGVDALQQSSPAKKSSALSTGFAVLDAALGIAGVPRGYLTEFSGLATSGSTTAALRAIASANQAGEAGVYIDLGHTFDPHYAARCGVNVARLLLIRPVQPTLTLEMVQTLLRYGGAGVIVVDAALVPLPLPVETSALKSITRLVRRTATAVIVLTSARLPIPSLSGLVDVKLRFELERWLKRRQHVQGYRVQVSLVRNKFGVAGTTVSIAIAVGASMRMKASASASATAMQEDSR